MLDKLLEGLMKNRSPQNITLQREGSKDVGIALIPDGMKAESLKKFFDEYREKPDRRKGTSRMKDIASFVELTNRFKNETSAIFQTANVTETSFSAQLETLLNYHPAGSDNKAADNADHRVHYDFPLSDEIKTWLEKNGEGFDQKSFAEFLEDNIADLVVVDPTKFVTKFGDAMPSFATPSAIMALSRGIEVHTNQKCSQAYRVSDGSFNVQFAAENVDAQGGKLTIPEWFALGIPVFENGDFYQIPVRLRFRLSGGALTWYFQLYRKNDVFRRALDKACADAKEKTGLPIYHGSPE